MRAEAWGSRLVPRVRLECPPLVQVLDGGVQDGRLVGLDSVVRFAPVEPRLDPDPVRVEASNGLPMTIGV